MVWLFVIVVTLFLGAGGPRSAGAAGCASAVCLQIEQIRVFHSAGRYVFEDPSWGNAVTAFINDLDRKVAYMDRIQKHYPTRASWESTVEAVRSNYLFSLNGFLRLATLLPAQEEAGAKEGESGGNGGSGGSGSGGSGSANGGENSGGGSGAATEATQRIVLTLGNGSRYAWQFIPSSGSRPARLISEGKLE